MVSVSQIQRCFERGDFDRLVRTIAVNGAAESLPLRARLAHPAPATGLGLRRLVEVTYGPTSLSRAMASLLIHLQRSDGSFAGGSERDPIATAAAAAGLGAMLAEPVFRGDDAVRGAHERAVAALASMQDGQGLFSCPDDRTWQDRALTSAFVLMMLTADGHFRGAVRFSDTVNWLDENEFRLDDAAAELFHLARVGQPADCETLAIAAIAA